MLSYLAQSKILVISLYNYFVDTVLAPFSSYLSKKQKFLGFIKNHGLKQYTIAIVHEGKKPLKIW